MEAYYYLYEESKGMLLLWINYMNIVMMNKMMKVLKIKVMIQKNNSQKSQNDEKLIDKEGHKYIKKNF